MTARNDNIKFPNYCIQWQNIANFFFFMTNTLKKNIYIGNKFWQTKLLNIHEKKYEIILDL